MLLPCAAADRARVRLYGMGVAVALAVAATLASLAPLALGHRGTAPPVFRGTTLVYALPVAGGPPRLVRRLNGQWGFPRPVAGSPMLQLEKPYWNRTELWRLPLGGGRLVRSGSMRVFTAPQPTGRFTATVRHTMHHGVLTVRNPSGSVAWRHAVPPQTGEVALAPDGHSAVILRNGGLQLLGPHIQRYLYRGLLIDPAFSPNGRLVYALRVKLATSMPK